MGRAAETAIEKACRLVGGQAEMARRITDISGEQVTPQAIYKWMRNGRPPVGRVLTIFTACDEKVTCHELRPDKFPKDKAA